MRGFSFIKYIAYFLILNLVLNFTFRVSPILGIIAFGAFIYYSVFRRVGRQGMWGPQQFRTTSSTQQQSAPKSEPTFKKDPNVIDAEYQEHKPN